MTQESRFQEFVRLAEAHDFRVLVENRGGMLFLKVFSRRYGVIAMWPVFWGSVEDTARYALDCFQSLLRARV